jgi:hypothetical protein
MWVALFSSLARSFLSGKCVVVRKLGWVNTRAFGSLAIKSEIAVATAYARTDSCALKALTVEATSAMDVKGFDEKGILRHTAKSRKEVHRPGAAYVLSFLDTFPFMGLLHRSSRL